MTEPTRAVLDTNVFVSASLSKSANSPTRELLERWKRGEFQLITCKQVAKELIEKLKERGIAREDVVMLASALIHSAEWIEVVSDNIEPLLSDPDDDVVLACAVIGGANFLVTYDPHFDPLNGEYRGVKILKAIPFLEILRKAGAQEK